MNGIVEQVHAEQSRAVGSYATPDDDAGESDGPSTFLLLREQPWPVAAGVLAGEVPDLEVPGLQVLDPDCYRVGVVRLSFSATSTARISLSTRFSGGGYPVRRRRLSWRKDSPTTCRSSSPPRRAGWTSSCDRTALSLREPPPPRVGGMGNFPWSSAK